ncbi:MAG: OmpA family protein [Edaphobacter sp.]|uniref:OmpA family protein n=1 Tax=Edaphobacter sp. TaxID=1934404 RepID=UPI00239EA971|nr:OmpA family protein [Edaphobacter sp.]MDE1176433.1 OmpA family protein [Edaphobacter sp.]
MSSSILENVMSFLGPQVSGALASQMGESSDTVQRGLEGGAAAMLSGLVAKSGEPGVMNQIFEMLTGPQTSGAISGLIANPVSAITGAGAASPLMDLGSKFLSLIFGTRMGAVTDAIGQYSGMGAGKAGSLLTMAAPLVLGGLSKFISSNHASPAALVGALEDEAPRLQGLLPAGFRSLLSGLPGTSVAALPEQAAKTTSKWLWPVVLLAALLLLGLWFSNRGKEPVKEGMQSTADATSSAASSAMASLGNFFKTSLPNGVELNIPEFGVENKLISFLKDDSKQVDSTTWFNFDRLTFDTGKATLQPTSQEQLNNIAEILKAYPKVNLKLGGYTDNTGDASANMALSAARAKNVMDALVAKGIDASRLESEGYGDQYPVGDNSTEEGRQANRRIALRVTQK